MSLIERYIAEVGRHLPEKDRADIEAEIRSMLEDMIEERVHQTGRPMNDEMVAAVLEELGDPKLLAQKYASPKRYLIGPDWYDAYLETLKRVLATALPAFAIVTFSLALAPGRSDVTAAVEQAFGRVVDVAIGILFWVTVGFVIVERSEAKPRELGGAKQGTWTVAQLPQLPKKRQISIGEALTSIVFVIGVTAWVALPFFRTTFQGNESIPFLNPDLRQSWLPLFLVIAGLTLIHEVFKLVIGNWTPALTITNVILCLISIVYIIALVTTQEVINPAFLATLNEGGTDERDIAEWARWTINISAAVIIGIYIWDMINSIVMARRLNKQGPNNIMAMEKTL